METALSPEDDFPGMLLHQAALWDNYELLEDLLRGEQRAHINSQDSWGRTPIHAAAITNKSKCLAILLRAGADPNIPCGPRGELRTALHISAKFGFVSNIRTLLKHGAVLATKDKLGLTPLDIAERSEHVECVAVLQHAANEQENMRHHSHTALREACLARDVKLVNNLIGKLGEDAELIINMAPNGANTLLFLCCEMSDKDLVALLLDYGADGRVHPVTKYSPLYIACYNGHHEIAEMILNKFPELIRQLTVEKWLPIHATCIGGHVAVLELLLNFNYPKYLLMKFSDSSLQWDYEMAFDINMKDASGQTPLYLTCLLGNIKMCETLLRFRVKATKVNASQEVTPTSDSAESVISPGKRKISGGIQNIMSRLNLRIRPEGKTKKETEKQISPLLLDLQCAELRETALHVSVRNKCAEISSLLLLAGANPNIYIQRISSHGEDDVGINCLVEAAINRDVAMVDMLLRHGARDDFSKALSVTVLNKDDILTAKLLSIKAHPDPEYKLNKKAMTEQLPRGSLASMATLTYSSVFPNTPVMINWHGNRCLLTNVKSNWLVDAAINVNPKLRLNPKNQEVVLFAITRLDLSNNALTSVPLIIFRLPSLRYLNLSQNKLEKFPQQQEDSVLGEELVKTLKYNIPVLEELCCQNNRLESIPEQIFRLPSLTILDVSNNKLQSLPPNMWTAPSLKELNASFNLLKDLPTSFEKGFFAHIQNSGFDSAKKEYHTIHETSDGSQLHVKLASPVHFRNYQLKDLRHQNLWSSSVEIAEQIVADQCQQNCSQLSALNLAHNLFTSVPPLLACLAVNLTRLNMSYNNLRSMSHVTTYPSALKQLDLSYNAISCWPSLPQVDTLDALIMCYSPEGTKLPKLLGRQTGGGLRNIVLHSLCPHRRHLKLENLRTLIIADNCLERIQLTTDEDFLDDDTNWDSSNSRSKLLFPNLSMLDISNNKLKDIPHNINDLNNLSVLNISGNTDINELPAQMGLLSRLWNLNTSGCNLQEPLKTMIESKKYKTMDVIGYLKSVLEDARPYARMKLMVVGVQGIGKTSLLEQLRQEGLSIRRKPHEHWVKRMGNKNISVKTPKGTNMSTVGVDIGVWVYDKKTRGQGSKGPVMFRTWDFGGQREYYATHQYFLSKRSLYLVVWKITDGHRGIREIRQWLVNIQARAPNSPVLIVGTHFDEIIDKNLVCVSEELQQHIKERFINVVDAEKCGLPRVLDTIAVSCRTRHNIKLLCNLIYDTVFSLRPPGSKELLLEQRVPASYLALEDVVIHLAADRRTNGVDPVLNAEQYKTVISAEMQYRYHKTFRDWSELYQATIFLHENGVLLHYEDATLRDLYFLDPQWLCDMLAHVVTIREINPFARSGLMKLADLKHIFKPSNIGASDSRGYLVNLLNKFEVALTWDNCTLLIPSLLPSEEDLHAPYASPAVRVKIPVRSRGWAVRSKKMMVSSSSTLASNTSFLTHTGERVQLSMPFCNITPPVKEDQQEVSNLEFEIVVQNYPERSIRRLLLMSYFPSGFWSRLITRLLADDTVIEIVRGFFSMPKELKTDIRLAQWLDVRTEWLLWQTGMALKYGSITLFQMKEFLIGSKVNSIDYRLFKLRLQQDGNWTDMDLSNSSILEIYFPIDSIVIRRSLGNEMFQNVTLDPNPENVAKLLALAVDHIDTLLEDWYPTLGTRFVHTSEGKFLVTRLIPCPKCLAQRRSEKENEERFAINPVEEDFVERIVRNSQDSGTSDVDSGVGPESNQSSRLPSAEGHPDFREEQLKNEEIPIFSWMVEECILSACCGKNMECRNHGEIFLSTIAPDTIFCDLGERHLIRSENITKGSLLGRGAFGFVFKGSCKIRGSEQYLDVAMKMLQPVQPGSNARQSALLAYKVAQGKWDRDPLQYACKAYCTARQELNILLSLRHSNIVPLIGVCIRPLALVLDLAPQGALDAVLRNYRRSGDKIKPECLQEIILQVAKAIEYLHQQHIIYRDLKSENVLVWSLPPPFQETSTQVHVKLADYGISRLTLPSGSKGFGGTEGFMAPEMMRFNGEEEYTEKVDCFSFGMFIYELLTLHQPFEGHESVKECILEGGRPPLTHRELLYPTCILDLMVLCWTQQPRDRPSASQIVSMASSPEFIQLCDCTALDHTGNINAAAGYVTSSTEDSFPQAEVWLPGDGGIDILSGTDHNWEAYKFIPFGARTTAIAVVNTNIWIGDEDGNLRAFDVVNYSLLWNYVLADAMVIAILPLEGLNRVAVGLTNGRLFLVRGDVCPMTEAMAEGSFVMTELGGSEYLYTLASLRIEKNICELWVGEAMGFISIFTIKDEIVSGHDRVNHYKPVIDKVERVHIFNSNESMYSYVYPGCMVYQWDVETREISSTLDCTKLVPCSESLKPLTIEDLSEKCQVTSVAVFCNSVYIGTAWGCVIVAERTTLYPVMVFRPFEEEVKFIIPFLTFGDSKNGKSDIVVLVGRGYRSLSARNTDMVLTPSLESSAKLQKLRMHLLLWKHCP